jgi:hypothetical protein
MIKKLYYKYVPESEQDFFEKTFLSGFMYGFRTVNTYLKSKLSYWFRIFLSQTEKNLAYIHMGRYGVTHYPGNFELSYKNRDIPILKDEDCGLIYVMHNGKRLYCLRESSEEEFRNYYRGLITEQDEDSPHRYVNSYQDLSGKVLLDIGSAEGIFALDTIEYVDYAYLFECEEQWIEALEKTFEQWKDKITIIRKYIGEKTGDGWITIDDFLQEHRESNLFIKMDIEGAEMKALKGAIQTMRTAKDLDMAVCTYHNKKDADEISRFFAGENFEYALSKGYLFMNFHMRRGVIRAHKMRK